MNKVWTLPAGESWICDRFVEEWNADNADIVAPRVCDADVVWLLSDWRWRSLVEAGELNVHYRMRPGARVLVTVHHIVPEKFGALEHAEFARRDRITTAYHVYNQRTFDFIKPLTLKPIHLLPYWANDRLFAPSTQPREALRNIHGLPVDGHLVGSFQRDTEGAGIARGICAPKLEKGPDLFCDYVEKLSKQRGDVHVVLAGWRRQYVISRLEAAKIPFTYLELPPQEVVNELYQTLDVYAVASRCEGGPQALIEAGLLNVPVVSRPVGIAEQVLPTSAINEDVSLAVPAVPNVEAWKVSNVGYEPYRKLLASL